MINKTFISLAANLPDTCTVESELRLAGEWDPAAVCELIRSKCTLGWTPAFLFLGRAEAALLRQHLAEVFGAEAVPVLKGTYYMGLEVIEIDVDSFVRLGGRKVVRILQDPIARRPPWRDRETDSLWQLRIR
jgi:hypothetical protein